MNFKPTWNKQRTHKAYPLLPMHIQKPPAFVELSRLGPDRDE
jgi:hypothetical protein